MDPKACLLAAWEAIHAGELDQACDHLDAYAEWRGRGGFEPNDIAVFGRPMYGDEIADVLKYQYQLRCA
jgi:hypothetical protein